MRQRGKKSEAQKATSKLAVFEGGKGKKNSLAHRGPPDCLDQFEAGIWQKIVGSRDDDWFDDDTEQLVISYCKHSKEAFLLDQQLAEFTPKSLKRATTLQRYDALTKMRRSVTTTLLSLSRSMRLTQQSINPDRAMSRKRKHKEQGGPSKPWEA